MGLGKTLQGLVAVALAHDDAIAESPEKLSSADPGPRSLVVCPSSVVGHWVREIERFFPSSSLLRPICYVGTLSERKSLRENELSLCNMVVTSYSVLRSDIDFLDTVEWCCCTLDEGHLLKNPRTGKSATTFEVCILFPPRVTRSNTE